MQPFPHQLTPIKVLSDAILSNRSALDASETGCGKTFDALFAIKQHNRKAAIVCPKSVKPAWTKAAAATVVETLFVENIEQLKAKQTWLQGDGKRWNWSLPAGTVLVIDEVHRFAGHDSENGFILAAAPKPVLMLSATCAEDPTRMRGIAHQLGLARWNEWYSWCARHGCKKGYWGGIEFKGKPEDLDKLHRAIFRSGLGTRVKQSEIEGFPDNFIEAVAVPVEDQKAIDDAYLKELEALENEAPNSAVLTLRARQISEHEKIAALLELVGDLNASGNSVAIFVHFRDSLERIQKALKCPVILGDQSPEERQHAIDTFNRNECPNLCAMIQAGGESISLPDRDGLHPRVQLIFPGHSARELAQAWGRCPRADSKSKVITKILFAADTYEEKILNNVQRKLKNQATLNDGDLSTMPQKPTTPEPLPSNGLLDILPDIVPGLKPPTGERPHANLSPSKLKNLELSPQWVQDQNQDEHPVTEAGTRMHKALETGDVGGLNDEERGLAIKCNDFAAQFEGERYCEVKLEITEDCYGYADLIILEGSHATLIDYKFGFNQQEDAETNPAAQAYVLGIFNSQLHVETVDVYYLYPRLDVVSAASYTRQDIPRIQLRLEAIKARVASGECEPHYETCLYCGNKATCTYLKKFALPIATRYAGSHDLQMPAEYEPSLITDPATMSKALAVAQVMERWSESVKYAALKMRQDSGAEIPGYDMRSRQGKKKVILPAVAWHYAERAGVAKEEFLACCDVSITKLSDIISDKAKRGEKKKAAQKFEDDLRDLAALEVGPETYYLQKSKG